MMTGAGVKQTYENISGRQLQSSSSCESTSRQKLPNVLAGNVNNLIGSARSRLEGQRTRYNGPSSPAAHGAQHISHLASISAYASSPPPTSAHMSNASMCTSNQQQPPLQPTPPPQPLTQQSHVSNHQSILAA